MMKRSIIVLAVAAVATAAGVYAAGQHQAAAPPAKPASVKVEERLEVGPPPFSDGIFPCSECHKDLKVNRTRRVLTDMHTDINFAHDAEHRWCLDCHDANDRDHLHLASGELVSFEESYRLCGQCHGEKFRDWRAGVHGRRTGEWNGHKKYLLCASCHNPHQPHFKPIVPKPAPVRPTRPSK
jgi:hypothetical protein